MNENTAVELAVYEPPMLVEAGGFAEETQGAWNGVREDLYSRFND